MKTEDQKILELAKAITDLHREAREASEVAERIVLELRSAREQASSVWTKHQEATEKLMLLLQGEPGDEQERVS